MLKNVLFVDPGLGGTGWAFFPQVAPKDQKHLASPPDTWGVIRGDDAGEWEARAAYICDQYEAFMEVWKCENVVIEFPGLFQTGLSFAATQKGDIFKLAYLVGSLGEVSRKKTGRIVVLVSPSAWKGQLKKDIVVRRILQAFPDLGKQKIQNHAADAIGMGLSFQGLI